MFNMFLRVPSRAVVKSHCLLALDETLLLVSPCETTSQAAHPAVMATR